MYFRAILFICGALFFSIDSIATSLEGQCSLEVANPGSEMTSGVKDTLQRRRVLFLTGYLGDFSSYLHRYFGTSIDQAQQLGMQTQVYSPASFGGRAQNLEDIHAEVLRVFAEDPAKPLILVGHSKGGAEALHLVLRYPELLLDGVVDRVVLVQAAVGGSRLGDYETLYTPFRFLMHFMPKSIKEFADPALAKRAFRNAFKKFEKNLQARAERGQWRQLKNFVSNRIFYVRSWDSSKNQSAIFRLAPLIYKCDLSMFGRTDGVLTTRDQKLHGQGRFGTDLGLLRSDHGGFANGRSGNQSEARVEAFTRVILQQIYETTVDELE
jgi:pimeloyl-ACP methyl ester carboxylesterase